MSPVLQIVLMASKYSDVFRPSKPPYFIQRPVFLLLTPVAYLPDYRPTYRKYLEQDRVYKTG